MSFESVEVFELSLTKEAKPIRFFREMAKRMGAHRRDRE